MPIASVRPARIRQERPLWTAILGLLETRPSHGYELVARLNEAVEGTQPVVVDAVPMVVDAVTVYRALRAMEAQGILSSTWDVSQRGPARRVYVPTPAAQAVGS